ncbi:MAG: PIG-L deacetylase family protein [Thermoplasmatales archaeon]
MLSSLRKMLLVSAHSADFVWRAGGVIAKYSKNGWNVKVLCLSYGERGESAQLWKSGKNLQEIKQIRKSESSEAAKILGAKVSFLDWDDYPLIIDQERIRYLVKEIREFNPEIIITHGHKDPFNVDHVKVSDSVIEACILSQANGVLPEIETIKPPRIFGFEHHQPELSEFNPDVIIDITDSFDLKNKAMQCFKTQNHLIEYYSLRALLRGNHLNRISGGTKCKYAEAFMRYYPFVGDEFP